MYEMNIQWQQFMCAIVNESRRLVWSQQYECTFPNVRIYHSAMLTDVEQRKNDFRQLLIDLVAA
jgi:hypothetical protein